MSEEEKPVKRSTKETLRLAVEQYFIRLHGGYFDAIHKEHANFNITRLNYDATNESHTTLVRLCKEKLPYAPVATDRDIFYSILKIYQDHKDRKKKQENQ